MSNIKDSNIIPYKLCGDDMIGIWPKEMCDNYESVVRMCNGRFSKGKHYRSQFKKYYTDSKTLQAHGHFTEETFRIECTTSERVERSTRVIKGSLDIQDVKTIVHKYRFGGFTKAYPVAGLISELGVHFKNNTVPWWYALGPAASEIADMHKGRKVHNIIEHCHPGVYEKFRKLGFDPVLPRIFGGIGLPPRTR